MTIYTIKCKPCGATVAAVPRITEHVLGELRIHIEHACPRKHWLSGLPQAGEVLREVNVETAP